MKSLTTSLSALLIFAFAGFAANGMADDFPVELDVEAPHDKDGLPLLSDSGWPILLEMTIKEDDAIGYYTNPNFPGIHSSASILFDDPDGCISWDYFQNSEGDCEPDETYLRFYPDTDVSGAADNAGDPLQRDQLLDSAGSASPEFQMFQTTPPGVVCVPGMESDACVKTGPNTGGEVSDGWGIGSDDDIPGLVLLSSAGIGIAFQQSPAPLFDLPDPLVLRNLAGLNSFVSYELSTAKTYKGRGKKGGSTVYASKVLVGFNVPMGMVRNIVQVDECVGDTVICEGPLQYRVDGGAVQNAAPDLYVATEVSIDLFDFAEFELSAFVVSGNAPAQLADEDGDGDVDSDDAELAGFTVLSNEIQFSVMQYDKRRCFGGGYMAMLWDLDGNGNAEMGDVCPAGPGDIKRPPR